MEDNASVSDHRHKLEAHQESRRKCNANVDHNAYFVGLLRVLEAYSASRVEVLDDRHRVSRLFHKSGDRGNGQA